MVARLVELLQRLLASVSMVLDVQILQHVTTILQHVLMMDHVSFQTDVPIQRHVTTILQRHVMMDHVSFQT